MSYNHLSDLNCSVRQHSHKQIELKLTYPLKSKKLSAYRLDCYFFFPPQLHITEKRISHLDFLNSMQINTRFSSPLIPLEKVLDPDFDLSPLTRLETLLESVGGERRGFEKSVIYELQTLCNLYRAETRNFVDLIRREIRKDNLSEIYRERVLDMLTTVDAFLHRFRSLHARFLDPHINETLREALRWADESISIITEKSFISLHGYCDPESDIPQRKMIEDLLAGEEKYRQSMNYEYLYNENQPHCGEKMAYRDSMLKKWSQSAMYMNSQYSRTPNRIGHLIAGTAAGLAMFFAVTAAIVADKVSPENSSLWILVMVISYIMKDRIKEVLRKVFGNLLPGLTTDQQINLFDPALKTLAGRSSGMVEFTEPVRLPGDILDIRFARDNPFRKIIPPNTVIHYRKIMKIRGNALRSNHTRLESLTEIIRFQVDSWLKEMDDPKETLYRLEKGKMKKIQGTRVYRIHMVIKLDGELSHKVLVLKKSGLVRIENY
ncbi:hypothetical protein [Spirochaeta isovalerica]|uniref:Uncharacterized protein n=1 Tax=Spirochaeta isovalerica TaxID=150 RepID=A0A841RGH9_9SPIO|nr:hypothetical protein [Spirochaeta isovalerica]MBB6482120.1 hypothetical protein [Spirochaeta isovalerica]